jgi:hypothetical protein
MLSVAKPTEKKSDNESWEQSKNKISDFAEKYAQHEQRFVEKDRSVLKKLSRTGNIFLWGAGAKGVMYANMIDPNSEFISGIVDVNPYKQGGFIPGSGHMVISHDDLPQSGSVIIMNENYTKEIKKQVSSQGKEIRLYSVHRIAEQIS